MKDAASELLSFAEDVRAAPIEFQHTGNRDLVLDKDLSDLVEKSCEILGDFHGGFYDN